MRVSLPLVGLVLSLSSVIAAPTRIDNEGEIVPELEAFDSHIRQVVEAAKQDPQAKHQVIHDSDGTSVKYSSSVDHDDDINPFTTLSSVPVILRKRDKKQKQPNTLAGDLIQNGLIGFNPQPDPTEKKFSKKKGKGNKNKGGLTGFLGKKVLGNGSSSILKKQALRFDQPGKKQGGANDPTIMINPKSNHGIISIKGKSIGPFRYGTTKKAPEP
ncbi:hypothetical protein K492DRAFT_193745 [Lichtheimia hyalospora FSU 10163]|nr:hypothetical protein K492DRAFT_193745 [Lichtheimia hyalospora FSU 10163]